MAFIGLPVLIVVGVLVWQLRQSGKLTIRLAGLLTGVAVFSFFLLAGSPSDVHPGESAIAGLIVGSLVGSLVAGYLLVWRKFGGRINGLPMKW